MIADGHHRFETALGFSIEEQARLEGAGERLDGRAALGDSADLGTGGGAGAVMAFVVELPPDQLHVRTIHRLISGLPGGFDLVGHVSDRMTPERFAGDPSELSPQLLIDEGAIGLVTRESTWLLRDARTERLGGGVDDVLSELDSVRVRSLLSTAPPHEIDYEARWPVALDALRANRADAVFMIRPVTVDQIGRAARAGVRMPPKTTFFLPKPRTGMVFRPLD